MHNRSELQTFLESTLGSRHVYFQPPPSLKITYPAIVYGLSNMPTYKADDMHYAKFHTYEVTYVHDTPDNAITDTLAGTTGFQFNRRNVIDNLYHDVYTITLK